MQEEGNRKVEFTFQQLEGFYFKENIGKIYFKDNWSLRFWIASFFENFGLKQKWLQKITGLKFFYLTEKSLESGPEIDWN